MQLPDCDAMESLILQRSSGHPKMRSKKRCGFGTLASSQKLLEEYGVMSVDMRTILGGEKQYQCELRTSSS